jgi:hypothetical protein
MLFLGPNSVSAYNQHLSTFEVSAKLGLVRVVIPQWYKKSSKRRLEDEQITQELYLHSDNDETLTSGDNEQTEWHLGRQAVSPLIYDKLN